MYNSQVFPRTSTSLLQALGGQPDSSVWREFFRHYAPPVFRIAKLRGLQTMDAEDIVQDVMVVIAKQISSFNYSRDRGRFRDWVRRITDHKIVDLIRRQRTRSAAALGDNCPVGDNYATIDQYWERQWQLQDLEYCLERISGRISERRLAAFRMYVLDGVSASNTARTLNMQVGYVYANRNQILNLIKAEMNKLESSEGNRS